jgi:hypothetical protein
VKCVTMQNPNVEAEVAQEFSNVLAHAAAEARNLFDLRAAQNTENATVDGADGTEAAAGSTSRGFYDSKRLNVQAKVPWFTGTHATYTWESFLIALEIAELNAKYSDAERKQMLLQNLDGAARMFLMANRHLLHATYEEVKAAFAKRFQSKKSHSLTKLRAMSMQPGEKVMLWYARVLAVGDNIVANDTVGITDPEQLAVLKGQMSTLELLLIDQFKRGLRSEIRNQMKAETFTSIESCAKAAEEAEEFLEATTVSVNQVGLDFSEAEVHHVAKTAAAVGQVRNMNERSPTGNKGSNNGQRLKVTADNVVCFRCQGKHFVRDCPEPPPPFSGQSKGGRSQGGSYSSTRSSSRDRNPGVVARTHSILSDQLDRLTGHLNRMCRSRRRSSRSSSRSASRSRRAGSRSRSFSRSRNSSRNSSRSGSRTRSSSRESRPERHVHYSSKHSRRSSKNH